MYIVYRAYDDNTADILDIPSYNVNFLTEKELISLGSKETVTGLTVSNRKIVSLNAYECLTFPVESEADEYVNYIRQSYPNKKITKINSNSTYFVLCTRNQKIHVDYYIVSYTEFERTYVANKGYTPYPQSAKPFSKAEAQKKAAMMQRNSKTGKNWVTERVACGM
jgi:hypothetical protein